MRPKSARLRPARAVLLTLWGMRTALRVPPSAAGERDTDALGILIAEGQAFMAGGIDVLDWIHRVNLWRVSHHKLACASSIEQH